MAPSSSSRICIVRKVLIRRCRHKLQYPSTHLLLLRLHTPMGEGYEVEKRRRRKACLSSVIASYFLRRFPFPLCSSIVPPPMILRGADSMLLLLFLYFFWFLQHDHTEVVFCCDSCYYSKECIATTSEKGIPYFMYTY